MLTATTYPVFNFHYRHLPRVYSMVTTATYPVFNAHYRHLPRVYSMLTIATYPLLNAHYRHLPKVYSMLTTAPYPVFNNHYRHLPSNRVSKIIRTYEMYVSEFWICPMYHLDTGFLWIFLHHRRCYAWNEELNKYQLLPENPKHKGNILLSSILP